LANVKENGDALLGAYRMIWNNRLLVTNEKDSGKILIDAITRELLDENSHPRARKNRFEKYYFAIKRVMNSTISTELKFLLIDLHNQIMEDLSEEVK
jgi:hypothetical protein